MYQTTKLILSWTVKLCLTQTILTKCYNDFVNKETITRKDSFLYLFTDGEKGELYNNDTIT